MQPKCFTIPLLIFCIFIYSDVKSIDVNATDWAVNKRRPTVSDDHKKRIEHLRNMCQYLKTHVKQVKYKGIQKMQQIYTVNWNTTFCVIPKSGCSFQKQLIIYLNEPSMFISDDQNTDIVLNFVKQIQRDVFSISRGSVHSLFFSPVAVSMDQFVNSSYTKIMTTRNPYSRLYSAYIDKVYIPVFHTMLKTKFHELWRRKYMNRHFTVSQCDTKFVTFEEFLEVVLMESGEGGGDAHWLPVSSLCEPCAANPDIIVKQEYYHDDMQHVLTQMHLNKTQHTTIQSVMGKHGIQSNEILYGLIKTMLKRGLDFMENCFTKLEIVERVWEALKVQGQMYNYIEFPSSKFHNVELMSIPTITKIFMSEMHVYQITAEESRQQRQRALERAFRNVRKEVVINLQAMYYYDFMLFNYDLNPPG